MPQFSDNRVHQNNNQAVAFGKATALVLLHALQHGTLPESHLPHDDMPDEAKAAWQRAAAADHKGGVDLETLLLTLSHEIMQGKEDSPFYNLAGRSCALPGAFIVPAFVLQRLFPQTADDDDNNKNDAYVTAIRQNILGAGDTCSRAILLGAILGALGKEPPQSWIDQVDKATMQQIDSLVEQLAEMAMNLKGPTDGGDNEL